MMIIILWLSPEPFPETAPFAQLLNSDSSGKAIDNFGCSRAFNDFGKRSCFNIAKVDDPITVQAARDNRSIRKDCCLAAKPIAESCTIVRVATSCPATETCDPR